MGINNSSPKKRKGSLNKFDEVQKENSFCFYFILSADQNDIRTETNDSNAKSAKDSTDPNPTSDEIEVPVPDIDPNISALENLKEFN